MTNDPVWLAETCDQSHQWATERNAPSYLTSDATKARQFDSYANCLAFCEGAYARSTLPPMKPTEHVFMDTPKTPTWRSDLQRPPPDFSILDDAVRALVDNFKRDLNAELERRVAVRAAPPVKTEGPTLSEMARACAYTGENHVFGLSPHRQAVKRAAEVLERLDGFLLNKHDSYIVNVITLRDRLGLPSEQRA